MYSNIFQIFWIADATPLFFFFYFSATSLYFIDLSIYFSAVDLDRMSRMFSLRFISEILSYSNLHCDLAVRYTFSSIFLRVSRSITSPLSLSLSRFDLIYLSSPFALFLYFTRFSISRSISRIGRIQRILV